jgi:dehydrogenase/reductase SDR family member 7B
LDTYFKNKVVVITGASSGIGEAVAYAFAALHCKVVLAARTVDKLRVVKQHCETIGGDSMVVACDVSKEDDCRYLIAETVKQFGTVDILINNAGISMRAMFAELDIQVLKQVFDINFWGTVYCTKYAMPYLLAQKGSVLSVSSVAGIKGLPGRTGYSASKFAMNGLMEALRIEHLNTGLYVGVICPGYTASNIRNTALNKQGKAQTETPLDESKLMQPEEVAACMVDMIRHRKPEVVLTLQGKLTKWLNKLVPRLVDKMVYNVVSKEKDSPFT